MQPRILLAGNAVAACRALDLVLEATSPDRVLVVAPPAGPHHPWQASLAELARMRDVHLVEPDDVNDPDTVRRLRDWRPELAFSVGYTQLFRAAVREAVGVPIVNFHPALLPRHRGVAPLVWTIVEGDTTTGVTAHLVDDGVDTGPIVDQLTLPIHPDATGYELHLEAAHLTAEMCARLLRHWLREGALPPARPQEGAGSLHRVRDATLNELDLSEPSSRVRNVVRALCPPFPGATLELGGERIVLGRVELAEQPRNARPPGAIEVSPEGVVLHTGDDPLIVTTWFQGGRACAGASLAARLLGGSR